MITPPVESQHIEDANVTDIAHTSENDSESSTGLIDETDEDQMLEVYKAVSSAMCRSQLLLNRPVNVADTVMYAQFELRSDWTILPSLPENEALITAAVHKLIAANHRERMFGNYKFRIERCLDIEDGKVESPKEIDLREYLK